MLPRKKLLAVFIFAVVLVYGYRCYSLWNTASVEVTIISEAFTKTGSSPKYKDVELPSGNWRRIELRFEAQSLGDPWDRLYTVSVSLPDGQGWIELHRGHHTIRWIDKVYRRRDTLRLDSERKQRL